MTSQDPSLLILRILFKESIKCFCCLLVVLVINKDLSFGHQIARRTFILDVAECNFGSFINLSRNQEINQFKKDEIGLLWCQAFIMGFELGVINDFNFKIYCFGSEILWDA